jgi:hypothetical protein
VKQIVTSTKSFPLIYTRVVIEAVECITSRTVSKLI